MNHSIESIQAFAKELIKVESSASIKEVYTKMLSENISHLPIIDQDGKRNVGLYKRKEIFRWLIENPNKQIQDVPINNFKHKKLPEVNMQNSLQDTMKLLHNDSAILVRNDHGQYSHLITPRVVANALEVYANRFMVYENLENEIRSRIIDRNINLEEIDAEGLDKPIPVNPENIEFGQYITIISKKYSEMGLDYLDKKTIIGLLDSARQYRNALMHFRLNFDEKGLKDAENLISIFRKK
ncbi:CBS domain-containing protein [Aureibaculum sp. A20]|uniref:CBS domain-containing protein n=1 Tax=Aureibaculum flavum TaxID=2795986 RepID=A0ABS0WNV9_9FLAO|nr:CBS domain-containing protein [Aureibaculum flavum]MBJ2173648.1 CBS domain-containing protein [Aureibaculum flavum]